MYYDEAADRRIIDDDVVYLDFGPLFGEWEADFDRTYALPGWEFGAPTAGHLIGHFPHERSPADPKRFSIRHGNEDSLREPDADGAPRQWILEIHFIDRARQIGGFFEELLTI